LTSRPASASGAEGRQFAALSHELLDGDVDQIGGNVLRLGGAGHRPERNAPPVRAPRRHPQPGADAAVVLVHGPVSDRWRHVGREPQAGSHMRDDLGRLTRGAPSGHVSSHVSGRV
jgi:hypothetical protein